MALKNRQKQIPNGLQFYDANLKWSPPRGASFQVICDGLRSARQANPGITRAKGLSTDPNEIANEVDRFNDAICKQHGWNDYVTDGAGGPHVPFSQGQSRPPNLARRVANVAAGAETIIEWIASGAEAVPQEQANRRAEVCMKCPLNEKGDWISLFTAPVSKAIQAALKRKGDFTLVTPLDDQLGVCNACDCPMALKVWVPFSKFFSKMKQEAKEALDVNCWIRAETPK